MSKHSDLDSRVDARSAAGAPEALVWLWADAVQEVRRRDERVVQRARSIRDDVERILIDVERGLHVSAPSSNAERDLAIAIELRREAHQNVTRLDHVILRTIDDAGLLRELALVESAVATPADVERVARRIVGLIPADFDDGCTDQQRMEIVLADIARDVEVSA